VFRRIARHSSYNLAGSVLTTVVSLVTVPIYLHQIGDARFGVLAIVWLLFGYFGLLDLGLSRATVQQIARLANAPPEERERVFWTATVINGGLGLLGALLFWGSGGWILTEWFKAEQDLQSELLAGLPWLALFFPILLLAGVFRGALEARSRFFQLNALQLAGAVLFQLAPLAVALTHGPDLAWLIPAAVLSRAFVFLVTVPFALRALPASGFRRPDLLRGRQLLAYGSWMTLSDLADALIASMDQLTVAAILGAREVAWYNVAWGASSRLGILPAAAVRALFPELSLDGAHVGELARQSGRFLAVSFTPVVILGLFALPPFLDLWVGPYFARHATPVGCILLVSVWFNTLALVPNAYIQGQGRPELTATVHWLELVPYAGLMWASVSALGIEGAAMARCARALANALLFLHLSGFGVRSVASLLPAGVLQAVALAAVLALPWASAAYAGAAIILTTSAAGWALWREPRLRAVLRTGWTKVVGSTPA
jgi:O-antigen/teichoic acid export membrane protein